jgi:hypothetical protein
MRAFIGRCQQMMSPLRSPALRGITSLQNRRCRLLLRSNEAMTGFADSERFSRSDRRSVLFGYVTCAYSGTVGNLIPSPARYLSYLDGNLY